MKKEGKTANVVTIIIIYCCNTDLSCYTLYMYFHEKRSASGNTLQLLQSYRNSEGKPRHRVVVSLGNAKIKKKYHKEIALGVERKLTGQLEFEIIKHSKESTKWIEKITRQIDRQGFGETIKVVQKDKKEPEEELELIDGVKLNKIGHTHTTSLGCALLGLQAWNELRINEKLKELGFNEAQRKTAASTVISRLIEPMSENALLENLENSSLPDILGEELTKGSKERFYRVSDKLLANKVAIEAHLRNRQQEHFRLERTILLYDLTNSHFEGVCLGNPKAKRGKNKQKRNDCNQIVVAMVFDEKGFELAHETFAGNMNDSKSLPEMVKRLQEMTSSEPLLEEATKSIVIVDAGIATKKNLEVLREAGFNYLVNDSRKGRKKYQSEFNQEGFKAVEGRDAKALVEVKTVEEELKESDEAQDSKPKKEQLVLCRSGARKEKEKGIITQAEKRFLEQLEGLNKRIETGKLKNVDKIQRAIGRILSKNPRVAHYYRVEYKKIESDSTDQEIKYRLEYKRDDGKYHSNEELLGCYVLRTDLMDLTASELWQLYMTLSYAEEGFEILKSDLGLRPNFHQIEDRVDGHIFITVLSYQLLRFILHTLKLTGDNRCWLTIKRIMETHCYATVTVPTKNGTVYRLRKPGQPELCQMEIYRHFNIDINKLPRTKVRIVIER